MKNGWEILEKNEENGRHTLKIYVEGKEVESFSSGSLRFLSSVANKRYTQAYNKHNTEGWIMTDCRMEIENGGKINE